MTHMTCNDMPGAPGAGDSGLRAVDYAAICGDLAVGPQRQIAYEPVFGHGTSYQNYIGVIRLYLPVHVALQVTNRNASQPDAELSYGIVTVATVSGQL